MASAVASSTSFAIAARAWRIATRFFRFVKVGAREADLVRPREIGVRKREVRIGLERIVKKSGGDRGALGIERSYEGQRSQIEIVSVEALGTLAARPFDLELLHAGLDDADHPLGDAILEIENVFEIAVELVGPQMRAGFGLDELGRDTQARFRFAHAAFQEVAHAQLAADLLECLRTCLCRRSWNGARSRTAT